MRAKSIHFVIVEILAVVGFVSATPSSVQTREPGLQSTQHSTKRLARTVEGQRGLELAVAGSIRHRVGANPSRLSRITKIEPSSIPLNIVTRFITWITARTGWLEKHPPTIQLVPPGQLNKMYFGKGSGSRSVTIRALYDKKADTIYLPSTWSADNLRDRSYLLHELVHHLQNLNKVEAACYNAYNIKAYQLQFEWLREHGIQNPRSFLNIGPIVLFMSGQCPLYRGCEFQPEGCP